MCSFIVKSLKHILAKFQTNWSNGKCFAAQYQSSLTWSRDAFWANRLPNQSTPKTVLALQHPINLLLVDRFTWNFVWVSFNHLVISIQRFNEFGVKMTVSEPLTWGPFFSGHPVLQFCNTFQAYRDFYNRVTIPILYHDIKANFPKQYILRYFNIV